MRCAPRGRITSSRSIPARAERVATLARRDDIVLGIATGKSQRGVRAGARRITACSTTSSRSRPPTMRHRSPIPAWCSHAMREAGVAPENTVVVGDTVYDIAMARAAGAAAIGVTWGYHPRDALGRAGAPALIDAFRRARARRSTKSGHCDARRAAFRHSSVHRGARVNDCVASAGMEIFAAFPRVRTRISHSFRLAFQHSCASGAANPTFLAEIASCAARRATRATTGIAPPNFPTDCGVIDRLIGVLRTHALRWKHWGAIHVANTILPRPA